MYILRVVCVILIIEKSRVRKDGKMWSDRTVMEQHGKGSIGGSLWNFD